MNQRKKQPVVTRAAILDAAAVEFSRHGYAGSGLGAIVSRAELTKGALFHHFPDKRALAVAWIGEVISEDVKSRWVDGLTGVDSLDRLKAVCRSHCLAIEPEDGISALVAVAAETAAQDPVLGAAQEQVFSQWREAIAAVLERGKSEQWIHRSIQPAAEAAFLVALVCGFTVTTKCNPDESARRACAAALDAYLETLRAV